VAVKRDIFFHTRLLSFLRTCSASLRRRPESRFHIFIPTGVAGPFFRAVRRPPATKRRDHGNQCPAPLIAVTAASLIASCDL